MRIAFHVGRFPAFWELQQASNLQEFDELHVHLLARGPGEADQVLADLRMALGEGSALQAALTGHFQPALSQSYA